MRSVCREDTTKIGTLDDTLGWVFFSIDELLESAAVRASKVLYGQNIKSGRCGNFGNYRVRVLAQCGWNRVINRV